eukprot:EG_transcript_10380
MDRQRWPANGMGSTPCGDKALPWLVLVVAVGLLAGLTAVPAWSPAVDLLAATPTGVALAVRAAHIGAVRRRGAELGGRHTLPAKLKNDRASALLPATLLRPAGSALAALTWLAGACGFAAGAQFLRRRQPAGHLCTAPWAAAAAAGETAAAAGQPAAPAAAWDLEAFSPSKVNLFLRILRRRSDGYHDLASLFQAISLGDRLSLRLLPEDAPDDVFECNMAGVPVDRTNLVLRAVDLLRQRTGVARRLHIRLAKTVPAQAGLGGGSGNAATALWAANQLFGQPATMEQLVEWSAELGSDITFFLSGGTAYCTGRGEVLTPLPPLPPQRLYIFKPDIGLSTAAVFRALDLAALSPADPQDLLAKFQAAVPTVASAPSDAFVNDLEQPAFALVPELGVLRDELRGCGFPHVFMSGSGTSIVALGEPTGPLTGAEVVARLNGRPGLQAFAADFIWRSAAGASGVATGWY